MPVEKWQWQLEGRDEHPEDCADVTVLTDDGRRTMEPGWNFDALLVTIDDRQLDGQRRADNVEEYRNVFLAKKTNSTILVQTNFYIIM